MESRVQSRKQPIFAAQGIQDSTCDPDLLTDNLNYMTTYAAGSIRVSTDVRFHGLKLQKK